MFEARNIQLPRKINLILTKSLLSFNDLDIGDKGQMVVEGYVKGERIEDTPDGEIYFKSIYVEKVEMADNKVSRIVNG